MPQKKPTKVNDYVVPLFMNGLRGRMLRMPAPRRKRREILLIYGHHASIERFFGLADILNDFGAVTMPDLPGFGGMDSFYKIGQKPTLDNLADYLAAFIKLRYRNRRFTITAISFGFIVVTRMLQKHPDIARRVDLLVSIVGFMHYDEFTFSRSRHMAYRLVASFFSRPAAALFFKNVLLHPAIVRTCYRKTHNAKHKFKHLSAGESRNVAQYEAYLWRCNDLRTHMDTSLSMLKLDNCGKRVDLAVLHLPVENDNYFDNNVVEQHMRVVFSDYNSIPIKLKSHSVSVIADKKAFRSLVPPKLRQLLKQDP